MPAAPTAIDAINFFMEAFQELERPLESFVFHDTLAAIENGGCLKTSGP
jgi:hypothetical protein